MRRGRWVWVFCVKLSAFFVLAVALENWNIYDSVLKEAFSILGCGLFLHPTGLFFSFPACHATSHPFIVSELTCLQYSHPRLESSPVEGKECHFSLHHRNQKQSPFSSNARRVHSRLWLCLVCRQWTILGLPRFSSALWLLSCTIGNNAILIWCQNADQCMQQKWGYQIHQLQHMM